MQPGQTITPGGSESEQANIEHSGELNVNHSDQNAQDTPQELPYPNPQPVTQPPEEPAPLPQPSQEPSSPEPSIEPRIEDEIYKHPQRNNVHNQNSTELSWTASEFVEHEKPQGWFLTVGIGAVVISVLLYFIVQDYVTIVVVVIAAIMFAVVGAKKPRSLTYKLSSSGLVVGDKAFTYDKFKSFSVIEEGAIDSIQLMPLQRFAPPISLYFPPDKETEISELLSDYLPYEERSHDPIDRLMKRFHF